MGYAPRQYLSIPLSSPKYRIWDTPPTPEILISYASVSIHLPLQPQIYIGHEILPHVSKHLSLFPARNIGYGICPLRGSIYLSTPTAADIGYGILPHVRVYLYTFPTPKFGYGIGRLHVEDVGCAPCAPPTQAKFLHVSIYLSPFPTQNIGCGI